MSSIDTILSHASELLNHKREYDVSKIPDYRTYLRRRIDELFSQYPVEHVHTDVRRSISEYNGADFSIQQFEVHSSWVPLGNHFHRKSQKTWKSELDTFNTYPISEIFVFGEWSGILLLQEVTYERVDKVLARGNIKKQSIEGSSVIVLPPYLSHTFFLEPGTKFRGFRPYPFDKDDMDMNPWKLELPR